MIAERRAAIVSTVVVVLLAAAGVFALWPRTSDAVARSADGPAAASGPAAGSGPGTAAAPSMPSDAALAAPRAAADLTPCPTPGGPASGTAAGPLAGIVLPCLGAPGSLDLGRALAGRVTLVNVWASWCVPCRAELPVLARYASTPGAVAVLGVDTTDDPGAALALLTALQVHLPAVSDPDGALRRALRAPPGMPLSYVVRADGSAALVDPPVPFAAPADVAAAVARLS